MLRVFDNIAEAIQISAATAYPLLVMVHDPLPEHVNHAGEALTTETFSFLPTGAEESFAGSASLPSHSATALNTSAVSPAHVDPAQTTGLLTQAVGAASAEAPATAVPARVQRFNAENAPVGKLKETLDGPLNPDFPLGRLRGGTAQKEAMLVTLMNLRLAHVCFIHLIEIGTHACENFERAMPTGQPMVVREGGGPLAPRVHVFPPVFFSLKGSGLGGAMPPFVLSGDELTPAALHHAVKMCLQIPFSEAVALSGMGRNFAHDPRYHVLLPAAGANRAAGETADTGGLLAAVGRMSAEAQRQAQAERVARETLAARPLLPGGRPASAALSLSTPASTAPSAAATTATTATTPSAAASAHAATAVATAASAAAPTNASVAIPRVHIEGLPGTGRIGAPARRRKAILLNPGMTARTVWKEVEAAAEKARRDIAAAKSAGEWNGQECELAKDHFYLVYGSAEGGAGAETLHSAAEASELVLSSLPVGTVFRIRQVGEEVGGLEEEAVPAPAQPVTAATTGAAEAPHHEPPQQLQGKTGDVASTAEAVVVCDGDTCRRVDAAREDGKRAEESASASAAARGLTVTLRCALPDGRTEVVRDVDVDTDTLRGRARGPVAAALDTNAFQFVCPFPPPPRRFSLDEDETQPLRALGITTSTALRVTLTGPSGGGGVRPDATRAGRAAAEETDFPLNPADVARASGVLHQMMRMLGAGERASPGPTASAGRTLSGGPGRSATTAAPAAAAAAAPPPSVRQGGFRSMADVRAAEEADERAAATEQLRREQLGGMGGQRPSPGRGHEDPLASDSGAGDQRAAMEAFFRRFQQQQQQQQPDGRGTGAGGERDAAGAKKKSNRYFGGGSTELISAPAEDDGGTEDGRGADERPPPPQAFTGAGRRLVDGAAVASGTAVVATVDAEGDGRVARPRPVPGSAEADPSPSEEEKKNN